jgi:hypothetical protein
MIEEKQCLFTFYIFTLMPILKMKHDVQAKELESIYEVHLVLIIYIIQQYTAHEFKVIDPM